MLRRTYSSNLQNRSTIGSVHIVSRLAATVDGVSSILPGAGPNREPSFDSHDQDNSPTAIQQTSDHAGTTRYGGLVAGSSGGGLAPFGGRSDPDECG